MERFTGERSILWRRLDRRGHEFARVYYRDTSWLLVGTAVLVHEHQACRLDYSIECDSAWNTASCRVTGWLGDQSIEVDISVDPNRHWRLNGAECPTVAGCTDVDLNFSPSTNLLPIRRLDLEVGAESEVKAAWLRFPSFKLERLDQRYQRLSSETYRYESAGGSFVTELQVNSAGLVTLYPSFCQAEELG
jgi:hypothetical protein